MAKRTTEQTQSRVYNNQGLEIESDTFKLQVANMQKDMSWNDAPMIVEMEHTHAFHTVDSDGKVHEYSTAIGGHFHKMKVEPQEDGIPTVTCVSGPLHFVKKRVKGKWVKAVEPISGDDHHTHNVQYVKSTKVNMRQASPAAISVITNDAQRTAPIPGVAG